jgi:hypothetical protein
VPRPSRPPVFPPTIYGKCFRAAAAAIRRWPVLDREVRTWSVWDGGALDVAPPTADLSPWVRLTPAHDGARWVTIGQHQADLLIRIETWLEGTDAEDGMGLWCAIAGGGVNDSADPPTPLPSALFPGDQSFYAAIRAAGSTGVYEIQEAAIGEFADAKGAVGVMATGTLRINIYTSTMP